MAIPFDYYASTGATTTASTAAVHSYQSTGGDYPLVKSEPKEEEQKTHSTPYFDRQKYFLKPYRHVMFFRKVADLKDRAINKRKTFLSSIKPKPI